MEGILEKIVKTTRENLVKRRKEVSRTDFQSFEGYETPRKSMVDALSSGDRVSVIAEIKKASPSKGVIRQDFDPTLLSLQYTEGSASAISVLTEKSYFQGSIDYLRSVRQETNLPLLRKDFIIDPYQIEEARAYGADAVLLIATVLEGSQLQELQHAAEEAGLQALVECYHADETARIDHERLEIVGVNNRDLTDFSVDLHRGVNILKTVDEEVVKVSESGLSSADDLVYLDQNHIDAALIGEHFMRQSHPGRAVKQLLEQYRRRLSETEVNEH